MSKLLVLENGNFPLLDFFFGMNDNTFKRNSGDKELANGAG